MQVKIVIGTISFMLTMIILGFVALREPERMATFTDAYAGRSIETGARIFQNNCATCHGISGDAKECYNAAGEVTGCQGLPLNDYGLVCGEKSVRMIDLNWAGTKRAFVETTISAGRFGTAMPTWSARFGGPMRDDQISDVASYVLNFENDVLCDPNNAPIDYTWGETAVGYLAADGIVAGDPAKGKELYTSYGCVACHGDPEVADSNKIGPWLGEIETVGATRVDGLSALEYVYHSILYPSDFIAPNCPAGPCAGPPSAMNPTFARQMAKNPQDMADILAFLLGDTDGN